MSKRLIEAVRAERKACADLVEAYACGNLKCLKIDCRAVYGLARKIRRRRT